MGCVCVFRNIYVYTYMYATKIKGEEEAMNWREQGGAVWKKEKEGGNTVVILKFQNNWKLPFKGMILYNWLSFPRS